MVQRAVVAFSVHRCQTFAQAVELTEHKNFTDFNILNYIIKSAAEWNDKAMFKWNLEESFKRHLRTFTKTSTKMLMSSTIRS